MYTKILFIDDNGDMMMDYAISAYKDNSSDGSTGVTIDITSECSIFIKEPETEHLIKRLFDYDTCDLTEYGPVIWIDENNIWSDESEAKGNMDNGNSIDKAVAAMSGDGCTKD